MLRTGPTFPFVVAVAARALVSLRTEVPARDGATYLWMAEEAAVGRIEVLFDTVFHPLHAALVALPLALFPDLDPVTAGQWLACGLGALAVFPLHSLTRRMFGSRAAFWAALLYAIGAWFCRHPADCLSEGPFYLAVTFWALCAMGEGLGLRVVAGLAAACAYLLRPEGAILLAVGGAWLWIRGERRAAFAFAAAFAAVGIWLPVGSALAGSGFTLSPKADFVWQVGMGSEDGGLPHYLRELARLPGAALDDLGFVTLPLAIAGVVLRRPRTRSDPRILLLVPFLVQCAVIPVLHGHYRFVSGYGILLLPFAGTATTGLLDAAGRWGALWPALISTLVVASEAVRLPHHRRPHRVVERELGSWLATRLRPGETLVTDMPRVAFYARRRPPPPRRLAREDLLEPLGRDSVRIVAWVAGRTELTAGDLEGLGLEPLPLPSILASEAGRRGVLVYEKPK